MSCDDLITNEILAKAKQEAEFLTLEVESQNYSEVTPEGQAKRTVTGRNQDTDTAIDDFNQSGADAIDDFNEEADNIIYSVGFNIKGTFQAGITIETYQDALWYDDGDGPELFAIASNVALEYITTGATPDLDSADWRNVTLQDKKTVARAFGVKDTEVIYHDDTVTPLDNIKVIYDHSANQRSWYKPGSVNDGETIVSVVGAVLETTGGTYPLENVLKQTVSSVTAIPSCAKIIGSRVNWLGYYATSDGGSNWGIVESGMHTHDGVEIFTIDANTFVRASITKGKFNVRKGGATESNATVPIQAIINKFNADGGGNVYIPDGNWNLIPSVEPDIFVDANGDPYPATNGALILRPAIGLSGASRTLTTLTSLDQTKHAILLVDGLDTTVEDIRLEGGGELAGGGAGIFNINSTTDQDVIRVSLRRLYITKFGGYGIGLNDGYLVNALVEDCETYLTGSDGIDAKSRSSDITEIDKGNTITNFTARAFGQRLAGACAIDLRGIWNGTNIAARGFGTGVEPRFGVRLRPADSAVNNYARKCNLTNIEVDATGSGESNGVYVDGIQCNLTNVNIDNPHIGIVVAGNAKGTKITNAQVSGHREYAVEVSTNAEDTTLVSVGAENADGATAHFRIIGLGTNVIATGGDESAPEFSVGSPAVDSFTTTGQNARYNDTVEIKEVTTGRAGVRARGPSENIDIAIEPKGTGLIRYGELFPITTETPTHWFLMRMSDGTTQKVLVGS